MDSDLTSLNRVLRAQLTAVHQQFVHIQVLRHLRLTETAGRISEVDGVDFPSAMRIIDRLVSAGHDIRLDPDPFSPGADEPSILTAELDVERNLCSALSDAHPSTGQDRRLIEAARAPRKGYAEWLVRRLSGLASRESPSPPHAKATADVFACLVATIEQAMVHAFVHWHHGDRLNADSAWATSGAAMIQATGMVRWLARSGAVPIPGAPPPIRISATPADAVQLDRRLAAECALRASLAAERRHDGIAELCRPIAEHAARLARWNSGDDHPAQTAIPGAFGSFKDTLKKFVRP